VLAILNQRKLESVLAYMLDENEFLGPTVFARCRGITWISFVFHVGGEEYRVQYCRANRIRDVRGQTPTGEVPSGCRQCPAGPRS